MRTTNMMNTNHKMTAWRTWRWLSSDCSFAPRSKTEKTVDRKAVEKARRIVKDIFDYIGSQGVSLDSDTREALGKILGGKLASGEIAVGRDSDTCDDEDKA